MEDNENIMTDYQFEVILKLVLAAIESSKTLEEAKEKVRDLLRKEQVGDK